jgi:hypothetical protein
VLADVVQAGLAARTAVDDGPAGRDLGEGVSQGVPALVVHQDQVLDAVVDEGVGGHGRFLLIRE